jgi:hypothetical protein
MTDANRTENSVTIVEPHRRIAWAMDLSTLMDGQGRYTERDWCLALAEGTSADRKEIERLRAALQKATGYSCGLGELK